MTQQANAPGTLRDRARQLATQEILQTALRLFTEQGFDETSVAQIAREAGVSQRTLFRYFGGKEDLLGGGEDRFLQVLVDTISSQPVDADAWDVLRAGIVAVQGLHDSRDEARQRFRLLHSTASLRAGWLEKQLRLQEELLPLLTARVDAAAGSTDLAARAVLATVFGCLDAASMTWIERDGEGELVDLYDECVAAVRRSPSTRAPVSS